MRNAHFKCTQVTQNVKLIAVIINRHCISDTWNLLTHLQFWKQELLGHPIYVGMVVVRVGARARALPVLTWQTALVVLLKRQTFHSSKNLRGKSLIWLVVSAVAPFASCSSAFEAQRRIRHISAIKACHEEQSHLEITQTAVFKDQAWKDDTHIKSSEMCFCVWMCVCATLR